MFGFDWHIRGGGGGGNVQTVPIMTREKENTGLHHFTGWMTNR